jgi:hypothetical protein
MANRPCKPDADMKRLWQTLLPGTPMPACGTGEADDHAKREPAIEPSNDREGGKPGPKPRP